MCNEKVTISNLMNIKNLQNLFYWNKQDFKKCEKSKEKRVLCLENERERRKLQN